MLKSDIVNKLAEHLDGYLKRDIGQAVDIMLEAITEALVEGRRVEIRGFGSFSTRQRKARKTENPRTGKIMNIPARRHLHFTMSKSLKDKLTETP